MGSKRQSERRECTEVQIEMPWGHISGKWWGPQNRRPILALHGWQDNAGTFDTLIPLLPPHIGILAIDLPGHGISSRLPDGQVYHLSSYLYMVIMIMEKYDWEQISLLGHSLGSILAIQLAAIFPDKVDLVIGLDTYQPINRLQLNFTSESRRNITTFLTADERNRNNSEPPSYSYDECIEKLFIGGGNSINRDKCCYIVNRNIQKSTKYPDKYYFTRDSRLKAFDLGVWPKEIYSSLLADIKCPLLFIKATDTKVSDPAAFREHLAVMKENPLFEFQEVVGTHHVHLNEPHKVSGMINQFLLKYIGTISKL
ncbi:unnamed protein product [Hermetia illucens]|uniref:AB hydrolase-1 domain-containing protein n=1 Tax=Hermetia illucens TaxID=343691 RepID=A0A7R8UK95_HERIL|nr:probable serine hydrolase isoform X4 [Hermetia illucens]XP_037905252.1 probable serine hydrolase isoform X4 [Hermetia illucens]CAD7082406.1 unnamed protein product [Hermetia illucens]